MKLICISNVNNYQKTVIRDQVQYIKPLDIDKGSPHLLPTPCEWTILGLHKKICEQKSQAT